MRTPLTQPLLPELGPAGSVEIGAPPARGDEERGWPALLLPLVSGLGMLGFAVLSHSLLALALGGGFAVLSAFVAVGAGRHQRRRRAKAWAARSEHYRTELASQVTALAEGAARQCAHALAVHPAPGSAADEVRGGTVWSSPSAGPVVRLGLGRAPAQLTPHRQSATDPAADGELAALAHDAASRHSSVDGVPLTLDLAATPAVVVVGDLLPLVRAVIVSLARAFGPERVRIHVLAAPPELAWIRRLPQAGVLDTQPGRFCAELRTAVNASEREPVRHLVVLACREDDVRTAWTALAPLLLPGACAPVSVVALLPGAADPPTRADVVISLDSEGCLLVASSAESPSRMSVALPDALPHAAALEFAATMQTRLPARVRSERLTVSPRLDDLLTAGPRHRLRLPIGVDDSGAAVTLDLREAAHSGDGPHGLVVGATGSGKSELLRTLLMGAASQNGPQELNFLLVDFKGGAAFSALAALPHTAGLLTNLSADLHGVERLCAALRAELRRRQQLLREGDADDIDRFNAVPGGSSGALPRLLVVIDEYAELIEQSPDVLDVLTSVARLGRSLGVHLLLCSQRLDDGRLRGLEAHLRYRICLRTFTASESMAVLGSADAAKLPTDPGWGYLNRDGVLTRLRVALADPPDAGAAQRARPRARAICPPPLPEALSLDQASGGSPARAAVVIGRCDRPDLGQQPPLTYDPARDGHVAVMGAPRSGRSTLLTTLVAALTTNLPTRKLAVHVVTAAGSPLVATAGLPHVGTVATAPELAARVIRTVAEVVTQRRTGCSAGDTHELLVIDDLGAVLAADEELAAPLALIATSGQSAGVTLAVSCGRWAELRGGAREALTTRFELTCHDPADSMLPQLARTFPKRPAGRVLTGDGHWAQVALPRLDGVASTEGLAAAVSDLVAAVAHRGGPATPPVQLLPSFLPAAALSPARAADGVVLGVTGPYVRPAEIGMPAGEHLLVLGNSASGRSGLLRSVAAAKRRQGARIWIVDPRRTFADFPGAEGRACTGDDVVSLIRELAGRGRTDASEHDVLIVDDLEVATGRGGGSAFLPLLDRLPIAADQGLSVVAARRIAGYGRAAYEPFFASFLEVCENAVVLSGDPAEGLVVGGVRPRRLPAGRGQLVIRGEPAGELQAAWLAPDCDPSSTNRIHTSAVVPRYDSWAEAL